MTRTASTPAGSAPEAPRFQQLKEWLEKVKAELLWRHERPINAKERFEFLAYRAGNGGAFLVLVNQEYEDRGRREWSKWRDISWTIYVEQPQTNSVADALEAAEIALGMRPVPAAALAILAAAYIELVESMPPDEFNTLPGAADMLSFAKEALERANGGEAVPAPVAKAKGVARG